MAENLNFINQPLILPKGIIRQVCPSLVHKNKIYAYDLLCELPRVGNLSVDARQLPVDISRLQGQYGELSLYATQIGTPTISQLTQSAGVGQYLGQQLSLVFFPELLSRYKDLLALSKLPEEQYPAEDGIPEFQNDYAQTLEEYTPQGFCLGDYQSAPMLRFGWGTVLLTESVDEQLRAVAKPGEWVNALVSAWSLACFKSLGYPN